MILDFERSIMGGLRRPPVGATGANRVAVTDAPLGRDGTTATSTFGFVSPFVVRMAGGGIGTGIGGMGGVSIAGGCETSSCSCLKLRFFRTIGVDIGE
jgi:hypothetical protein